MLLKMHCNVSQWLVTHLQRVQWMKWRYASWEMIYFTAFYSVARQHFFKLKYAQLFSQAFKADHEAAEHFVCHRRLSIDKSDCYRLIIVETDDSENWLSLYADCLRSIFYCYLLSENHLDGNSDYWRMPSSHKNNLWLADKNVFITCK